jgi:TonB family protein
MVYRRIELTPAQQLKGLRETRDRYAALAESLRESGDPRLDHDLQVAKERDALRIAHAYEKSIANSVVRMSALGRTHQIRLPSLGARTWLAFFVAISLLEGGLLLAYFRPAIFQIGMAAPRLAVHRAERVAALPPVTQAPPTMMPKPIAQPAPPPPTAIGQPQTPPPVSAAPKPAAQPLPIAVVPTPTARPQPTPLIPDAPKPSAAPPPITATPVTSPPVAAAQKSTAPTAAPPPVAAASQPSAQPTTPSPAPVAAQPSAQAATPAPIASFVITTAPSQTTAPAQPQATAPAPSPPAAPAQTRLEPIMQTHSLPPYPPIAKSLGEAGTTRMRVAISAQGVVTDCAIVRNSGSMRLDGIACNYVQEHWRWNPPTRNGQPVTASTDVSIIWNLKTRQ